jgi:hypothetical protein
MAAALEADVIDRAAQVGLGFAVDDEVASTWLTALKTFRGILTAGRSSVVVMSVRPPPVSADEPDQRHKQCDSQDRSVEQELFRVTVMLRRTRVELAVVSLQCHRLLAFCPDRGA